MKIELKSLHLLNFKAIRDLTIPFDHTTNIFGANETGKTTISDAWHWLLFDKDSLGKSDFEIKTLDENNNAIPEIPHEVEGIIEVNETTTTLKKCLNEKWTRRRGSEEKEFTGHETTYFYNDVPVKAGEYKSKISEIIDENLFRLITNPTYFNTLPWEKRRGILISISEEVPDGVLISSITNKKNEKSTSILETALSSGKKLEEFKKEVSSKKRKVKDELDMIPARIEEVVRSIPEPEDYVFIEKQIEERNTQLSAIENLIMDKSKAHEAELDKIQEKQNEIHSLKTKLQQRTFDIKTENSSSGNEYQAKVDELKQSKESLISQKKSLQTPITITQSHVNNTDVKLDQLRKDFAIENAKEFKLDPSVSVCPTCNRPFDDAKDRELELQTNFNTEKARKIDQINKDGQKYKADKENFLNELNALKEKEKTLQTQIEEFNVKIQTAEEDRPALVAIEIIITADRSWKELKSQIDIKEAELLEVPKLDVSALLEDKSVIIKALDELKAKLSIKEVIEIQLSRKEELLKQEKSMSQELASLEGLEYTIFQFEKAKIDNIEEQINSRFKMAKFRLFKTLINNSVEMCCDTLYKGVPYNSLNAAARIQVGIDIINVLSEHYGVRGVLYIDNRESTTEIPETNSQVVNLYVSPEHKELTIK